MITRYTYSVGFIVICLLIASSIYLQVVDGFEPCPLCTLQRITFGVLGVFFMVGIIFNPRRIIGFILSILLLLSSILGLLFASRQIWLQHFSTNNTECGVSLNYMLQVLPLNEVMKKVFTGSAECSQRGFVFLHLNTAEWAFIWFLFFIGFSLYLITRYRK